METKTLTTIHTFAIDPAHSRVGFAVRHLGFSKVRGNFKEYDGNISLEADDLSTLSARVNIKTDSVTTNDAKRDEHLRTGDFFLVETYPIIEFKSTGIKSVNGNLFTMLGELTMRGVTKNVELKGEYLGKAKDPWGNTKIGFEAKTQVNRKDFGVNWNAVLETGGFLVSDDVEIILEIQAAMQPGLN